MADTVAWLTQVTPQRTQDEPDEYRLAQLFRPGPGDRRVFAVAIALMRRQLWAVPVTALLAFGRLSKLVLAVLTVAGTALAAWLGSRLQSWPAVVRSVNRPRWTGWPSLGWAVLDLAVFFASVSALLVLLPAFARRPRHHTEAPPWLPDLATVSSQYQQADRRASMIWRSVTSVRRLRH